MDAPVLQSAPTRQAVGLATARPANPPEKSATFRAVFSNGQGGRNMKRTTVVVAEASAKRDLFFFLFGVWAATMLQLLL